MNPTGKCRPLGPDSSMKISANFIHFYPLKKSYFSSVWHGSLSKWLPFEHSSSKMGSLDIDPVYSTLCSRITTARSISKFYLSMFQYSIRGAVMPDAITYGQDCMQWSFAVPTWSWYASYDVLNACVCSCLGMQNLSIACSLVSLIILVSCLLIFWIGLIERQVPPVLVVSVLYLLAGTALAHPKSHKPVVRVLTHQVLSILRHLLLADRPLPPQAQHVGVRPSGRPNLPEIHPVKVFWGLVVSLSWMGKHKHQSDNALGVEKKLAKRENLAFANLNLTNPTFANLTQLWPHLETSRQLGGPEREGSKRSLGNSKRTTRRCRKLHYCSLCLLGDALEDSGETSAEFHA